MTDTTPPQPEEADERPSFVAPSSPAEPEQTPPAAAPFAETPPPFPQDPYAPPSYAQENPYAGAPVDAAPPGTIHTPYGTAPGGYGVPPTAYPAMAPGVAYGVGPNAPYGVDPRTGVPYSDKSKVAAGVLQILLGAFGVGRFYIGDIGVGIAQIAATWLTCGIGVIWPFVDGILMLLGDPVDSNGRPLRP